MWRYLAGAVGAMLLMGAGILISRSMASTEPPVPQVRSQGAVGPDVEDDEPLPAATAKTREERRFNRYDKDRNGQVAREEYLMNRRKAFAKLDANGDGRLTFDEWAIKASDKFAGADKDKSGALTTVEFAATAVKRTARPRVPCPPARQPADADAD